MSGKVELKGSKWHVEGFKGKNDIVVEVTEAKQSVLVFKCEQSVVTVKGKCTSVSLDNSKKSAVIFDHIIATLEVVNCNGVQAQCNGSVPSITIDKTQGCNLFLQTADSKKVEIVSSASTEINVTTPGKTANDDPHEQAIPSQFVTKFGADGKLITKPSEHVGV